MMPILLPFKMLKVSDSTCWPGVLIKRPWVSGLDCQCNAASNRMKCGRGSPIALVSVLLIAMAFELMLGCSAGW